MGIYINGMEMPTSCQKCPFLDYEEGFCFASGTKGKSGWYEFTLRPGEIKDGIHDDCPLVNVPPHGRLIDADALIDAIIAKYIRHERHRELVFAVVQIKQDMADIINEIPTIIPAEEDE